MSAASMSEEDERHVFGADEDRPMSELEQLVRARIALRMCQTEYEEACDRARKLQAWVDARHEIVKECAAAIKECQLAIKEASYWSSVADKLRWRPVICAPKDKTILVFLQAESGPFYQLAKWEILSTGKGMWTCSNGDCINEFTHWMPLPEPPE